MGLGGTFDSTNIVNPLLSVITSIGHDHMAILGNTIEEIAGQKAGIIKNSIPVITGVNQPEALGVIEAEAEKSRLHISHYIKRADCLMKRRFRPVAFAGNGNEML